MGNMGYWHTELLKKNKMSLEEMLFYMYFALMLIAKGTGMVSGEPLFKAFFIAGTFFIIVKILIGEYTAAEYVLIIVSIAIGMLVWHFSGTQGVLICTLLIISMKNVQMEGAFRLGGFLWGGTMLFQILTQLLNLRTRDFVIHNKFHLGYLIRWAMGYSHPNVLQISYTVLVIYILYTHRMESKKFLFAAVLSFIGACYIFMYSLSATGMIYLLMFFLFLGFFEFLNRRGMGYSKVLNFLLQLIFPIAVGISVLGPIFLKGRAFDFVNKLVTTRLALSRFFLTSYELTPFGQDFSKLYHGLTLDCSYTNLLMYAGIVPFVLMCIGYALLIRHTLNQKRSWENSIQLALIFSSVITGMSEPFLYNESFKNLTLLLLGAYLFRAKPEIRRKYCMIKNGNRQLQVSLPSLKMMEIKCKTAIKRYGRRLFIMSLILAAVGSLLYAQNAKLPTAVYALRSSCDTDDSSVNLYFSQDAIHEMREQGNIWVLNYIDDQTPLLKFTGRIIQAEYFRGIIGSAVWSALIGDIMLLLIFVIIDENLRRRNHANGRN